MLLGVLDTETTGLVRKDYMSPDNPHLASLTLIIFDTEANRVQASFNTMIQPDDWEMPVEAGEVNGLDTETLAAFGIPLDQALRVVASLLEPVELLVAHNVVFDVRVMAAAYYRTDLLDDLDGLLNKEIYCTMNESKYIVQAKGKTGRLKNPKLTEAYSFFYGKELDNAHSANADTVACLEIYMAVQEWKADEAREVAKQIDSTAEVKL